MNLRERIKQIKEEKAKYPYPKGRTPVLLSYESTKNCNEYKRKYLNAFAKLNSAKLADDLFEMECKNEFYRCQLSKSEYYLKELTNMLSEMDNKLCKDVFIEEIQRFIEYIKKPV
jgi:hypothetical protein